MLLIFGSFFLLGFIMTLSFAYLGKRVQALSFLTPNRAGLSSSMLVAVSSAVFVIVSCDSDCRLFPDATIGVIALGCMGGLAGSTAGVTYLLLGGKG